MKVTTERLDNCQVNLIVEMDAAEIDKKLRETARKISRQFTVPGYRRGKAPYHAVVRVFGLEALQQQTLEESGNDWYDQAIEQIEYEPYEAGALQEVEWDPFRMTVLLSIRPIVELGDYRAVRVPFEPEKIGEEQIDDYLAGLQQEHAQWVPVERPAALGDQVVLDMVGHAGEEEIVNEEDHELVLDEQSAYPRPGFHQEIVGLTAGEEKSFTLAVPEKEPEAAEDEEKAGEEAAEEQTEAAQEPAPEAVFTVRLHSIKEQQVPPLDDDLALMVGDYESLEGLKVATREALETEARQRAEAEYLDKVLEAMLDAAVQIEYPPQAIDQEADVALSQVERNLSASGLQLDTFLGMIGKTREGYKLELRPAAEDRLRKRLVLNQVAELEGLQVEPEELEAAIERLSEAMGEQAEQMRQLLHSPGGQLSVADDLIMAKAQERVELIAKGEAPPLESPEEAEADAEAEPEAATEPAPEVEPEVEPEAEAEPEPEAETEPAPEAEPEVEAEPEAD